MTTSIRTPTAGPAPSIASPSSRWPAGALMLGAAAIGIGDLLRRLVDADAGSARELTAAVSAHPATWLAAAACAVLGAALVLPGLQTLTASVAGRGASATRVGGALFGLGLLASVGHAVAYFGLFSVYADAGVDGPTVDAMDKASESEPLLIGLIALFLLGLVIGQLVLVVGLRRAGLLPFWAIAAALVDIAAGNSGGVPAGVVGLAGWVVLGLALGRATRRSL